MSLLTQHSLNTLACLIRIWILLSTWLDCVPEAVWRYWIMCTYLDHQKLVRCVHGKCFNDPSSKKRALLGEGREGRFPEGWLEGVYCLETGRIWTSSLLGAGVSVKRRRLDFTNTVSTRYYSTANKVKSSVFMIASEIYHLYEHTLPTVLEVSLVVLWKRVRFHVAVKVLDIRRKQ